MGYPQWPLFLVLPGTAILDLTQYKIQDWQQQGVGRMGQREGEGRGREKNGEVLGRKGNRKWSGEYWQH